MSRRPLVGLATSAVLHGALVAGVLLVVPRGERLPPHLVDLTAEEGAPGGPAAEPRPASAVRASTPHRADGERAMARGGLPAALPPDQTARPPETSPAPARLPETASRPEAPPAPAAPEVAVRPPVEDSPAPAAPVALTEAPAGTVDGRTAQPSDGVGRSAASSVAPGAGPGSDASVPVSPGRGSDSPIAASLGPGTGHGLAFAVPGGGSEDSDRAYAGYYGRLRQRVQEAVRFPRAARRRGLTGTVTLHVTIRPDGGIGSVVVAQSSSHEVLDEAAVEAVRSLRPQPFPAGVPARPLAVVLPVVFDTR